MYEFIYHVAMRQSLILKVLLSSLKGLQLTPLSLSKILEKGPRAMLLIWSLPYNSLRIFCFQKNKDIKGFCSLSR